MTRHEGLLSCQGRTKENASIFFPPAAMENTAAGKLACYRCFFKGEGGGGRGGGGGVLADMPTESALGVLSGNMRGDAQNCNLKGPYIDHV